MTVRRRVRIIRLTFDSFRQHRMRILSMLLVLGTVVAVGRLSVEGPTLIHPPGRSGREVYVAAHGTPAGDGSSARPFDIETVFQNPKLVHPGDVVWLRGGVYKVALTSELTGDPSAPIIVRQYPGERAILEAASPTQAALTVRGYDTWYWGFEVTDSRPWRITEAPTYTRGLRAPSVTVFGPRTRFINLVLHDGEMGFGFWSSAYDAELYGNIIYNVGFDATDRGHGHSIYVQNETGTKRLVDNILFNSHSFGVHAYTENGYVDNLHLEGNIAFNSGALSHSGPTANFLVRSKNGPPRNPTLLRNFAYYSADQPGRGVDATTPVAAVKGCIQGTFRENYLVSPAVALAISCQSPADIRDNTFIGQVLGISSEDFSRNTHLASPPTNTTVHMRPNLYERGRGHVVIYNWERQRVATVDAGRFGLVRGDGYAVHDAQNYFAPPVVQGVLGISGRIEIPLERRSVAAPAGRVSKLPQHTGPEFGVFVITKAHPPR